MIQELIRKVIGHEDLSLDESVAAMNEIMSGEATPAQIGAFIVALRMKGETVTEITGCARVMREKATRIEAGESEFDLVDTCGTGGDGEGTFNISTAAALVTAAAGVPVAKHGNRAVSSRSGSADVLKQLGVNIEAGKDRIELCLREAGIGFLFAPMLHGAMKYAIGPRREIGVRTVFNILGPLTNPAGAACQVLGVYQANLAPVLAEVLRELGSKRCMVVHGEDGLDEITITARTRVAELADGEVKTYTLSPEEFGFDPAPLSDLRVESVEEAADAIRSILAGEKGPRRDVAVLNAGAAIMVGGAAADLKEGIARAAEVIDTGAATKTLEKLIEISNLPA